MSAIFHSIVYQPLYNAMILFYDLVPWKDFGIAIILTTVALKLVLYPLSQKQIDAQKKMQVIQPKLKELQTKHKGDREAQARATMDLYKEHKVNPAAGCLPLIVQIIFLIAIYRIIINIAQADFQVVSQDLYGFVSDPGTVKHLFFGLVDLAHPNIPLAAIAALALYYQTKMMMPTLPAAQDKKDDEPDFASIMSKQMLYIGPVLTLVIGASLPSGLAIYWLTATLITIWQQRGRVAANQQPAS